MTVEEKIRNYFDDHHIFKSPYAEKAGISRGRFSRIMNGKTKITADEFVDLSKALEVPIEELLTYGEEA